jgi:hypothetical protein
MAVTNVQSSYATEYTGVGFAGQLADVGDYDAITGINEAGADVPFGVAVKQGVKDDGFANLSAGTDVVKGVTMHRHRDPFGVGATGGVQDKEASALLRYGRMYVAVEQAVVAGDPVFCRFATGAGGAVRGAFRKDADTATAVLVKGAKYLTTQATIGGIAKVQFDAGAAAT